MGSGVLPTKEYCKQLWEHSYALRSAARVAVKQAREAIEHSRETLAKIRPGQNGGVRVIDAEPRRSKKGGRVAGMLKKRVMS